MSFAPVHPGDGVTDAQVLHIYDGLRDRTLPKSEWTHGAHLCAGTAFLSDVGLSEAEALMPGVIRRYNEATGVPNTDSEGYHHTITLFYLRALDAFLKGRWSEPLGVLVSAVLAAPLADRAFLLQFYAKETLFSGDARRRWIEPDLAAAPFAPIG